MTDETVMHIAPPDGWWRIANADEIPSPALLIYPDRFEENVRLMVQLAGGAGRLTPHVKTHKLGAVIDGHPALQVLDDCRGRDDGRGRRAGRPARISARRPVRRATHRAGPPVPCDPLLGDCRR
jgi:hypothetical protein